MNREIQTVHYCTIKQAIALIKRQPAKTHFSLMLHQDCPTVNEDGTPTNKHYPAGLSTCMSISKRDAIAAFGSAA